MLHMQSAKNQLTSVGHKPLLCQSKTSPISPLFHVRGISADGYPWDHTLSETRLFVPRGSLKKSPQLKSKLRHARTALE